MRPTRPRAWDQTLLLAALTAALLAGAALRTAMHWGREPWVDEVFTGAIASTGSVTDLVRDCLTEIGGPVYYSLMWLWAKVFGLGNVALRLPSLIASVAAVGLILWQGPGERTTRLVWAGTTAALIPLASYSTEARSYALLFFLATAQAILLLKLLRGARIRLALAWSAVSALLILTHYHTAFLVAAQGLALTACLRLKVLRLWPAALPFVPVLGWMLIHVPLLAEFGRPGMAWQPLLRLDLATLEQVSDDIFGIGMLSMALLFAVVLVFSWDAIRGKWACYDRGALLVAGASLLAAVAIVAVGILKPSYHPRYMLPIVPGILLGVALIAQRLQGRLPWLPAGILLLFAIPAASAARHTWSAKESNVTGRWQFASEALMAQGVTRFAFAFDDPMSSLYPADLQERVGGFFFRRAGHPAQVGILHPDTTRVNVDANKALPATLDALPGKGRGGFIWVYSRALDRPSMGRQHPPSAVLRTRFACRNYGEPSADLVVLACVER